MEKDKKMITMYGIITLIVTIAQIIISQKRQLGMYEIQNLFTIVLVMTGILLLLCRRIKPPVIYVIIMLQLFVIIGIDIGVYQKGIIGENGKGITMHWTTIWIAALLVCGFIQLYITKLKKDDDIKSNIRESQKRLKRTKIKYRENVSNARLNAKTNTREEKWKQWEISKVQGYNSKREKINSKRKRINCYEIISFIIAAMVIIALVFFPVTVASDGRKMDTMTDTAQVEQKHDNVFRKWMDGINVISNFINVELKSDGKNLDNDLENQIENVMEDAKEAESENKDKDDMTGMQAIAQYVLLSTAILGCIAAVIVILQRFMADLLVKMMGKIVSSKASDSLEDEDFVKKYAMPICLLVLVMAILSAFIGEISDELLTKCWYQLLIVIMGMMILLVAIEIMRLIIEQSVHRYSLLIRCIRYVYVLVMNLTMSIIVGVIQNINVPEIISEFGGNRDHTHEELVKKVTAEIHEAMNVEIDRFNQESSNAKKTEEFKSTTQKVR